jgi:hypothetical protein
VTAATVLATSQVTPITWPDALALAAFFAAMAWVLVTLIKRIKK